MGTLETYNSHTKDIQNQIYQYPDDLQKIEKMKIFGVIVATFFVGDYVQAFLCAPRVNSASDCQKMCEVTTDCEHYTFIASEKNEIGQYDKCYMKKAFGWKTYHNENGVSGNKNGGHVQNSIAYFGGDVDCSAPKTASKSFCRPKTDSRHNCQQICKLSSDCRVYQWAQYSKHCHLKWTHGWTSKYAHGMYSGHRDHSHFFEHTSFEN